MTGLASNLSEPPLELRVGSIPHFVKCQLKKTLKQKTLRTFLICGLRNVSHSLLFSEIPKWKL